MNKTIVCYLTTVCGILAIAYAASGESIAEPGPKSPVIEDDGQTVLSNLEPAGDPPFLPLDTPRFIFGRSDKTRWPLGGMQLFGTMDKVGFHQRVEPRMPELERDIATIVADKPQRIEFVKEAGHVIQPGMTWRVLVYEAKKVGNSERIATTCAVGADEIRPAGSRPYSTLAGVHELWERKASGPPLLLRRSQKWVKIDTKLPE